MENLIRKNIERTLGEKIPQEMLADLKELPSRRVMIKRNIWWRPARLVIINFSSFKELAIPII